ncbi:Pr6Pr family membrane protein [Acholeplasma sp. OttesenSCG-928-E16]|nr:Pr6Pr family membrane protein [Acholeplasma sp. OttesenSCG-928-E16]
MTKLRQNRIFPLVFRITSIGIIIAGILLTCIYDGAFHISALMFYTLQSNILVLFLFILLAYQTIFDLIKMGKKGMASYYETFEFVCLIDILVTFFIYWIMLAEPTGDSGISSLFHFSNLCVHGITPLLVLFDYFLFTLPKKPMIKNVFLTWLFPLSYVVFSSIMGASGYVYFYEGDLKIHYPYFFLDFDKLGSMVALYVSLLLLFFTGLGFGIYFIDKKRLKQFNKPWNKNA